MPVKVIKFGIVYHKVKLLQLLHQEEMDHTPERWNIMEIKAQVLIFYVDG